jgi:GDP-mannose 6-dehydrogenase
MRIAVWGLGYVGTVSAACLAELGHEVVGVEPNAAKVDALNAGRSAVREPGLDDLVGRMVANGRLRALQSGESVVHTTQMSLICVGTPAAADGRPVLEYVRSAATDIARGLRHATDYHVIVLRSTVFPGTMRECIVRVLQQESGREVGREFGVVVHPEFMRETNAIADFFDPPYIIIGELDARSGDQVEALYRGFRAPIHRVSFEQAELLKMVNNAFHALKIGFANEIGRLCDRVGLDSHTVMALMCADTKLNISTAYLKPGFAFGGSCLPKDLRSLTFNARRLGVDLPILESLLPSNQLQIEAARLKVHAMRAKRVAILGLSFKPGTDDLRESPVIGLIRDLWQDGLDVRVYDPDLRLETMLGTNLEYLQRQLPQINDVLRPRLEDALSGSELVVVSQNRPEFKAALQSLNGHAAVLDLVRLSNEPESLGISRYEGLSW